MYRHRDRARYFENRDDTRKHTCKRIETYRLFHCWLCTADFTEPLTDNTIGVIQREIRWPRVFEGRSIRSHPRRVKHFRWRSCETKRGTCCRSVYENNRHRSMFSALIGLDRRWLEWLLFQRRGGNATDVFWKASSRGKTGEHERSRRTRTSHREGNFRRHSLRAASSFPVCSPHSNPVYDYRRVYGVSLDCVSSFS